MTIAKKGTYLVELFNGEKYIVGNNYKPWYTHAIELATSRYRDVSRHQMFKSVQYSKTTFVDDGGLKYCLANNYQEVIDEVKEGAKRPLIDFTDYIFENSITDLVLLDKKLERW